MEKILIGDHLIYPDDIESISERSVTMTVKVKKPNPKPKPTGFFGKAFYSDTVTVKEKHEYNVLVLKFASVDGYKCCTICNNAKLIADAKALKKELDEMPTPTLSEPLSISQEERQEEIMKALKGIGMEWAFYGWSDSKYLETSVMVDKSIKTKQDFIDKYM